ncbi:uncharacterized protein LOC112466062 [Temnothorax curvispinosus]|uniref:Uncharacterized protein LOC112459356 n=1 Tax=Temnothorax curvispinosus TaxID=300111 RepID=A0A6J1QEN6_9HYME|nr:uncharacterized protein LOC112459356 [Temnothorax curvispinosus]XP_024889714.1 uncharacterized protein LOC112466062 [Temnothorax curvispinosus]
MHRLLLGADKTAWCRLSPERRFSSFQKHKNFENIQKLLPDSYKASNLKKEGVNSQVVKPLEEEQRIGQIKKSSQYSQEQDLQQQLDSGPSFKRSDYNLLLELPDNFKVGQAIADGNCFFDSFRQGLEQQLGIKVTVEQLRIDCQKFAQNNPLDWFINAIANSHDNTGVVREETTDSYIENILNNNRWGDPEVEGRILCEKYSTPTNRLKLHVIEKHIVNGEEVRTDQIIDSEGSKSVNKINYNEENTIHIVNRGTAHFEPVLRVQEIEHHEQRSSDFSDYDDELTPEEELIYTIKSSDSEEEKLTKIKKLFEKKPKPNINFQDKNNDTPLHIAVRKKELKVIESLVKNGAKNDIKNNRDKSPLDIANRLNRQTIIQILETPLDSKPQQHKKPLNKQFEYKGGQQPSGHPVSITARQQEQSQYRNKNTNVDSQNTLRKERDHGLHGNMYQLKLLMLFLHRGVSHEYSFRLSTEIKEAKKFDDLVFEYTKDGRKEYRFLQAKHKLDESKEKITADSLLTESDGDYSLTKYFFSYQDSKKEKLFKDGSIKDVTICTNINFDFKQLEKAHIRVEKIEGEDDILDVKSDKKQPMRYRFNEDVTSLLKLKLQNCSLTKLARRLAECFLKNSFIQHGNDIFKSYHLALAKEVINIQTKQFHVKFIGISEDANKFREAFIEEIKRQSEGKLTLENINKAITDKEKIIDDKQVGLDLSPKFGEGEGKKNWPNNENLTGLATRLAECVLKNSSINHNDDIFEPYHLALAEEVINIQTKQFHNKFIERISEDANKFRKAFTEEIKKKSKEKLTLKNINKAITNKDKIIDDKEVGLNLSKNFGKGEDKNWPNNAICNDDVEDYLNHLVFAVDQPNEDELGEIIKDEIGNELGLDLITTENIYNKFFMTMLNWLQGKERDRFLSYEEGKKFFEEARRGIPIWFGVKEPVTLFTGRIEKLDELHKALQNRGEVVISQMTSVTGLGGVGKSELARKYISEHSKDYDDNFIWINAESYGTLAESFRNLAQDKLKINTKNIDGEEKDIKPIVEKVYKFFAKRKALFVFDNAEKYKTYREGDEGINKFLPSGPNKPYVLITSRNQEWGEIKSLPLDVFTEEEAITFIKKALEGVVELEKNEVKRLAEELQYFPLALKQAVAYIKKENNTLKKWDTDVFTITRYKIEADNLLELKTFLQEGDEDRYAKTVLTTWTITIDKIKEELCGKQALEILNIMAYFAPDKIPIECIFSKLISNKKALRNAVELLDQYSMANLEQGVLNIHRLVQQVTRIKLNRQNKEKEILGEALKLFQDGNSQIDQFSHNLRLSNVDHAISVWSYANKHEKLVRKFSSLPVLIVSELNATLRYQEAHTFGSNALELLKKILGDNHFSVLSTMNIIASVLYTQGKYEDSAEIYRKLQEKLDIIKLKKNEFLDDPNIGVIRNAQGRHDEALEIYPCQYNLVKKNEIYSDDKIEHNLVFAVFKKSIMQRKKLVCFIENIEIMYQNPYSFKRTEEVLESDHESTLNTKSNIAAVLKMGKYEEALKLYYKEVYEKKKRPNHPDTLTSYNNFAFLLYKQENYNQALEIANEVDKEREKLIPNHPRTLTGKFLIIQILVAQGEYDKALEKFEEIKSAYLKIEIKKNLESDRIDATAWRDYLTSKRRHEPRIVIRQSIKCSIVDEQDNLLQLEIFITKTDSRGRLAPLPRTPMLLSSGMLLANSNESVRHMSHREYSLRGSLSTNYKQVRQSKRAKTKVWNPLCLPEVNQSQLIQLVDKVRVTGESQSLANNLISNQKVMGHLNRVGKISGMTMHGMMAKNILANFLNGNYQGVAINVNFIAGDQGFAKVAETTWQIFKSSIPVFLLVEL